MPTPPIQPINGPGGSSLTFSGVTTTFRKMSSSRQDYWIITPVGWNGETGTPSVLPLVVFLHGFSAPFANLNTPAGYASWVERIARKGNIVVFPKYQEGFDLSSSKWTPNALASLKDALSKPWPSIQASESSMMLVGHSAGCLVAANLAHSWFLNKLPLPAAMLLAMPYKDNGLSVSLSGIPDTCKLIGIVGNDDTNVGRSGCDDIWDRTNHLTERSYVRMFSDNHGSPKLNADHHIPEQSSGNNALDWNGLWKFSDALRNYAFYDTDKEYVFGDSELLSSLGFWSDGVAVNPMMVTTEKP